MKRSRHELAGLAQQVFEILGPGDHSEHPSIKLLAMMQEGTRVDDEAGVDALVCLRIGMEVGRLRALALYRDKERSERLRALDDVWLSFFKRAWPRTPEPPEHDPKEHLSYTVWLEMCT